MTDELTSSIQFERNAPIAPLTTIGVGGAADYFARCASTEDILSVLERSRLMSLPVQILGGGSNLIFSDHGYRGIVMRIETRGIEWSDRGDHVSARVQAGEVWDEFVATSVERGLSGIECLSGIPGSVGATPIQNVGAYGQDVAETITHVKAIDRANGRETVFANAECEFGYRMSRFKGREQNQWIVTEVTFRLHKGVQTSQSVYPELKRYLDEQSAFALPGTDPVAALSVIRSSVLALRRKKSMVVDPMDSNTRSVGSFFMNPIVTPDCFATIAHAWQERHPESAVPSYTTEAGIKIPAAWLIEHAGFAKGYRKGRVGISTNHTLALVNFGGTANELFALADEIRSGVEAAFGVRLEREAIAVE